MNNKNLVRIPAGPSLLIQDRRIPIEIRRHRQARRISLRYDMHSHSIRLTLPWRASVKEGLRFVEEKRGWLARQIEEQPPASQLEEGDTIAVLGESYTLHYTSTPRGRVEVQDGALHIPGNAEFRQRRLKDWLKTIAKKEIAIRVQTAMKELAALPPLSPGERGGERPATRYGKSTPHPALSKREKVLKVSVRDTRSRWGSCSSDGRLNFSWRLALAPLEVMEYVICHEVAHLAEMSHSATFWKIVAELCPHHEAARAWLRKHGEKLHQAI